MNGYGFNDNMEGATPYFVRRWAPKVKAAYEYSFALSCIRKLIVYILW